jgi:hypothetical protein
MNLPTTRVLPTLLLAVAAAAQGPDLLVTFSQPETTLSGSAGTSLAALQPNEIAHLEWSNGPCSSLSAEKWAPRTCFHTMAGDEDSDAMYWKANTFGTIDALVATLPSSPIAGVNPRTVFWSPSLAMGTGVSAPLQLRPGDVGRIVRNGAGDGQVEHFLRQEEVNLALGLPITNVLDVDAVAMSPNDGVFLSLDQDVPVLTACGPVLLRDGDVFCIPPWAITWTFDWRVQSVLPLSAVVVHTEAQMDAFVAAAGVTNRFGVCATQVQDTESLEIDWSGPSTVVATCAGLAVNVPSLIFAAETLTGASLLTTAGGGAIWTGLCGPMGTPCGSGPTFGPQAGVQPTSATVGAPSFVNGLLATWTLRYSLEARTPVLNSSPSGLPGGATLFDLSSPAPLNFVFVTFAPSGINAVPGSVAGFPFSLLGFPDYYPLTNFYLWVPTVGGFATFPSFAIPPNFPVKLLFQSVGVVNGAVEFSTPAMLDIL